MTLNLDQVLRIAGGQLRAGDIASARATIATALQADPDRQELLSFGGLLACQAGDLQQGVALLRAAVGQRPDDHSSRLNLVTALVQLGAFDEAASVGAVAPSGDPRVRRLLGYVHQQQGRHADAAADYEVVVAAVPADWESWNNLGNARSQLGDHDGAIQAFDRAIRLQPNAVPLRINAAKAMGAAGRQSDRLELMRRAVAAFPTHGEVQFELGLAEASERQFERAETAFRQAVAFDPTRLDAYLELGLLLENLNRLDDLDRVIDLAGRNGVTGAEIDFLRAWSLRRRNRFTEAMPLAQATPASIDPIRRTQLIGELADRLGDADAAFDAFAQMKALTAKAIAPAVLEDGERYFQEVKLAAAQLTRESVEQWPSASTFDGPAAPIFIAGFPRSGTTLLDTLLMNVANLHVLEEMPVMHEVELALGDPARLPEIGAAEAAGLRATYFDQLARISPPPAGATVVDKFPLHMARIGLIHRLFPDARIVFAERHPCDVLLSCFVSNFQPNRAMVNFLTLEGAARLYDAAFDVWTRGCAVLPLATHTVRYERMVEDPVEETQALFRFLQLPWDPSVTDNQASAARRDHIKTASYAQVTEPIYRRSAGRWLRYRRHLEPVLPILAPWVERMGYTLDP